MGHVITATCKCGYHNEAITIGSGMANCCTSDLTPGMCLTGQHIVDIDIFDAEHKCPEGHAGDIRLYYNNPGLQQEKGPYTYSQWGEQELNSGFYFCPKCREYELKFSQAIKFFD